MMMLLVAAAACVAVEGEMIRLADFARSVPAFQTAEPSAPVAFAPSFGAVRTFAGADIQRLADRHGIPLPAPAAVCFERPSRRLDEPELRAALMAGLGEPNARLEVIDFARYAVPSGALEFGPSGLQRTTAADGTRLWRGRAVHGNHRSFPVWARVRVSWKRQLAVAASALPIGKVITPDDVRLEERECDTAAATTAARLEDVVGKVTRSRVAEGTPIPLRAVVPAPLVKRGEEVEVTVSSGRAQLKLMGRAQKAGKAGEMIPVRNPASGRTFPARVEGQGRVVVGGKSENRK